MYIDHFSVFYEKMSIEAFTHFLKSVIWLLLFWSWVVVVAIYSGYWPLIQMQSLQILPLIPSVAFLLIVEETIFSWFVILEPWQRSFGLTCVNLFKIPSLWFIGVSAYFAAGGTQFWLLWHSYLFWIQEAWRPHCRSLLLRLVLFFGFLFGCINFSIWGFFLSIFMKMTWDFVSGFNIYVHHF